VREMEMEETCSSAPTLQESTTFITSQILALTSSFLRALNEPSNNGSGIRQQVGGVQMIIYIPPGWQDISASQRTAIMSRPVDALLGVIEGAAGEEVVLGQMMMVLGEWEGRVAGWMREMLC
jgi:hypothetical protein